MTIAAAIRPRRQAARNRQSLVLDSALILTSAALIALAEVWPAIAWLSLFGFLPLLLAIRQGAFLRTWFQLWLFATAYTLGAMWWLVQTGAGVGWTLLAVPLYAAVPVLLPAVGLILSPAGSLRIVTFPFLWTAAEIFTRFIFLRLNWAIVGLPLADYPGLSQIASVLGPEGVSFVAAASSALVVLMITVKGRERKLAFVGAAVFGLALLALGIGRPAAAYYSAQPFKIGLVQPADPEDVIWTAQAREPFLARMDKLIDSLRARDPDMIVLPEGAVNGLVHYDQRLTNFVRSAVIRTRTPILFGSYDRDGSQFFNVAIFIDPYNTVATYRKIRLAPFVEYEPKVIPYRRPADWLRYTAGTEPTVFSTIAGQRFSAMICLEDSLPDLAREFARHGAQLLFGLISTQRYDGSSEHLQQLRRARLVAIAVGLPMARCANTGISCLIDPWGHILKRLPEGRAAAGVVDARLVNLNTIYRTTGDWVAFIAMLVVGFGVGAACRARSRS